MQFFEISAELREKTGKGNSRQLRRQGRLPATVYGKNFAAKSIHVSEMEIEKIYRTKLGINTPIELKINQGETPKVMIQDVQGHPIQRRLSHLDFLVVTEDQKVTVNIPIRIEGKAAGIVNGGVCEQFTHDVELLCPIGNIPEEIVVDVTPLEIGQNIHLSDIKLPEGITYREKYNPTLVAVNEPKQLETADQLAAEVAQGEAGAEGAVAATAEGGKPAEGAKPAEATKPAEGAKLAAGAKPAAGAKATGDKKGDKKV